MIISIVGWVMNLTIYEINCLFSITVEFKKAASQIISVHRLQLSKRITCTSVELICSVSALMAADLFCMQLKVRLIKTTYKLGSLQLSCISFP
jgi:hypothetical protein